MKEFPSPFRLLMVTSVSIFVSEVFIMLLLSILPPLSTQVGAFFDASLLSVLVFPPLYLFLFRPLILHLTERQRAEEALVRQAQQLSRANKDLEHFAYVASHDLQEPLRMVASYTQLLAKRYQGKLDADADGFIAYAVDGAARMQVLINDLLAYSCVATRAKPFEPTACEAVLDQALANLKAAIEECGAVVTHDPLPTVMADFNQLTQVFQNLIGNAIKFRGDEPPKIHVSAQRSGESRGSSVEGPEGGNPEGRNSKSEIRNSPEWVFSVRDNGIGIDSQYAERIFVIFQRLHGQGKYPGTGIGLAICKRIVERHGGCIWVESDPGKGSTFYFTMPDKQ